MIEKFTKLWFANLHKTREAFTAQHPGSYLDVVRHVVQMLHDGTEDDWSDDRPDPERIHEIDDGDYQGTLVYVIGATGYQPNTYWYCRVYYGSCSGCDTLERIRDYQDGSPDADQVDEYMQLALHVLQGLRRMGGEEA